MIDSSHFIVVGGRWSVVRNYSDLFRKSFNIECFKGDDWSADILSASTPKAEQSTGGRWCFQYSIFRFLSSVLCESTLEKRLL